MSGKSGFIRKFTERVRKDPKERSNVTVNSLHPPPPHSANTAAENFSSYGADRVSGSAQFDTTFSNENFDSTRPTSGFRRQEWLRDVEIVVLSQPDATNSGNWELGNPAFVPIPIPDECQRWQIIKTELAKLATQCKTATQAQLGSLTKSTIQAIHPNTHMDLPILEDNEIAPFLHGALPHIVHYALQLPDLLKRPIPVLKQGHNKALQVSKPLCCSLLANAFFCTFPDEEQSRHLPDINFLRLFQLGKSPDKIFVKQEKLKCILNYFSQMRTRANTAGDIIFERRYKDMNIEELKDPVAFGLPPEKVNVQSEGNEKMDNTLHVEFVTKILGGDVLDEGAVVEEIRFVTCPELLVARLFTESLLDTEALHIKGISQYSNYSGHGQNFKYEDTKDQFRSIEVVALNAMNFTKHEPSQQIQNQIELEIFKCSLAFYLKDENSVPIQPVATGNLGCGTFNGDIELKLLIQLVAASLNKRPMTYHTFGNQEQAASIRKVTKLIESKKVTLGQLYEAVLHHNVNILDYIDKLSGPALTLKILKSILPIKIVFCGEAGTGIGTAVSNLFTRIQPQSYNEALTMQTFTCEMTAGGFLLNLSISKVPGLLGNNNAEQDTAILHHLESRLAEECPNRIPTLVFFTARLDNNRFEGNQSTFSQTAKLLSKVRHRLTDHLCSNFVLILTHAENCEVNEDLLQHKIHRYRRTFSTAMSIPKRSRKSKDIPCILLWKNCDEEKGDNVKKKGFPISMSKIKLGFSGKVKEQPREKVGDSVADVLLKNFGHPSAQLRSCLMHFKRRESHLLSEVEPKYFERMSSPKNKYNCTESPIELQKGVVHHFKNIDDSRHFETKYGFLSRTIVMADVRLPTTFQYSLFQGTTEIVLGDGTPIPIKKCCVGNTVYGLNGKIGVVTGIFKVRFYRYPQCERQLASLYFEIGGRVAEYQGLDKPFRFKEPNFKSLQSVFAVSPAKHLYYVEVDGGDGTFVAGKYVSLCKVKVN